MFMNEVFISILALVVAYLLGSFPSAFIIGKARRGMDIRKVGSHNMGAMNTFYSVGFWWGMLVLAMDIGKGMLGVGAAIWLHTPWYMPLLAGLMVLAGHNFPVFLKFKGGKGGASMIGALVILMPWGFIAYPALFGLLLLITRVPTISYGLAFLCFPFLAGFLYDAPVYHPPAYIVYSILIFLFLIGRYIPRLKEMLTKTKGDVKRVAMRRNLKDRL
jgi:acyl phosphate:glycerol-3-phosphate acyltransferase